MFAKFNRFDVHVKAVDGVNQKTILGACITVLSVVIVLVLVLSEISIFFKVDVISRMVADNTVGIESVRLDFDIEFFDVPCERISFKQEVTRGTLHIHDATDVTKLPTQNGSLVGCRLTGAFSTDKVGGNFRFPVSPVVPVDNPNKPVPALQNQPQQQILYGNISHRINHVLFVPTKGKLALDKIPDLRHSLNDQNTIVPANTAIYQYSIQVVPTQYKTLYGELSFANQYAVNEKVVSLEQLRKNEAISGLYIKDFQGLIFTYDFHPVMLYMEERRERIVDFLSNLFGIVGGVISMLGIVETLLHQSTKALIGKSD